MTYLPWLFFFFCMVSFIPYSSGISPPKNIFILAGQSNMAGRGGNTEKFQNGTDKWDGRIPPESQPSPLILRLNPSDQWEEAHEPLHQNIDLKKTAGIGPGMPFANHLLALAGLRAGTIGLVPCARGGSYIQNWTKDPTNPNKTFYNGLISRIKASYKEGGTVRALFWYQGESDASNNETASRYKHNLKRFFTDVRNDVKPIFLPIILVKIAAIDALWQHPHPGTKRVRKAEDAIHRRVRDVQIIDALELVKADGEGYNGDRIHLNVKSEVALGKWLAETYLSYYPHLL